MLGFAIEINNYFFITLTIILIAKFLQKLTTKTF